MQSMGMMGFPQPVPFRACLRKLRRREWRCRLALWQDVLLQYMRAAAIRYHVPHIRSAWVNGDGLKNLLDAPDYLFRSDLRMAKATFVFILQQVAGDPIFVSPPGRVQHRPVHEQLFASLYVMGNAGKWAKVASRFRIGKGSVANYLRRCVHAICAVSPHFIQWPFTQPDRTAITTGFLQGTATRPAHLGFYGLCGVLDCTNVKLTHEPLANQALYYNGHKGMHSIKALAVVDHVGLARYLQVGFPGSVHDSRVFRNTALHTRVEELLGAGEYLLSDSGFALGRRVIPVFKGQMGWRHRTFNKCAASARNIVEHAFGVLKGRFPCLRACPVRIRPETEAADVARIVAVTTTCFVVYNICVQRNDNEAIPIWREDDDVPEDADYEYAPRGNACLQLRAQLVTSVLKAHHLE